MFVALAAVILLLWRFPDFQNLGSRESKAGWLLEPKFEVKLHRELVYANKSNYQGKEEALALDLYEPIQKGTTARPLIVFIHGGGFNSGDKRDAKAISEEWASRGYVVASVNYRLRPNLQSDMEGTIADALEDVGDAVGWLNQQQDTYRIDTRTTAIGGDSAGGVLAVEFANQHGTTPQDAAQLFAVVDIYGPALISTIHEQFPASIIIHGTADTTVPYNQSLLLSERLSKAGINQQMITLEGGGHNYQDSKYWDQVVQSTVSFLHNAITASKQSLLPAQIEIQAFAGDVANVSLVKQGQQSHTNLKLKTTLPRGWKLAKPESSDKQSEVQIEIPANTKAGLYPILLRTNAASAPLAAYVHVREPLGFTRTPFFDQVSGQVHTRIDIVNLSPRSLQGKWSLHSLESKENHHSSYSLDAIQPNQKISTTLPFYSDEPEAAVVTDGTGAVLQETSLITYTYVAEKQKQPLTIDGSLEEWNLSHPFPLNRQSQLRIQDYSSPDNFGGQGWISWDKDHVYLAVQMKDEHHVQREAPFNIYLGDSLQFSFRVTNESGSFLGVHEFGAALHDNGSPMTFRWLSPPSFKVGEIDDLKTGIRHKDGTTTYELALPWEELGVTEPLEGQQLKFSLLVNNNDGQGRMGWIEYNSGIGYKDADAFGDLFLVSSR
ncbi:alpha/beta hydrolase fold domain-containing protein [Paenibacillus gorillae]|uniref:alpha/beta hydrolase fold domain-containing protein n=1 Tax=Paenibacillus gorillae TaxID=1243662 RepID=UPI0004B5713E|nr:alpha/beta hydrolase fold domain-containing protein [Paenibacillus gorillae]